MTDNSPALVPAASVVTVARTLEAQGYPLAWQATRARCDVALVVTSPPDQGVPAEVLVRVRRLADALGEAMAKPDQTLTAEQIEDATTSARAEGFFPPAAYDDGVLIEGAVAGHPWDNADRLCARRLQIVELMMRGRSNREIAEQVGQARQGLDRLARDLRPKLSDPDWLAEVVRALDLYRTAEVNPTLLALVLDIVKLSAISATHPARDVLDHEREGARERARARQEERERDGYNPLTSANTCAG